MEHEKSNNWSSQLGFLLAAAGSSIGLGNIWRFPYMTGTNGGGAFVLIYLLPLLPLPSTLKTVLFFIFLIVGHLLNNVINAPKINWLMRSVPDGIRGKFTARKEMISLLAGMPLSLGLGLVADNMLRAGNIEAYYLICTIALAVLVVLHTVTLLISTEEPLPDDIKPVSPMKAFRDVLAVPSVTKVMAVGVLWQIANAFSAGFLSVYLQTETEKGGLGFNLTWVMIFTVIGAACRMAASPIFGRLADKISFTRSMAVGLMIAGFGFLLVAFAFPQTRYLYLVYLCLHSIGMATINSGSINLIFDFVPLATRQAAMGIKNAIGGVCAFLASLLGGLLVDKLDLSAVQPFGLSISVPQLLALGSVVLIVGLLVYIKLVVLPLQKRKEEKQLASMAKTSEAEFSALQK